MNLMLIGLDANGMKLRDRNVIARDRVRDTSLSLQAVVDRG